MRLPPSEKYHLQAQARISSYDMMNIRDPKHLEAMVKGQLRRTLCEELLRTGEVRVSHDIETDAVIHRMEVFVFPPLEFRSIVRDEAHRMMDEWMKGPQLRNY